MIVLRIECDEEQNGTVEELVTPKFFKFPPHCIGDGITFFDIRPETTIYHLTDVFNQLEMEDIEVSIVNQ